MPPHTRGVWQGWLDQWHKCQKMLRYDHVVGTEGTHETLDTSQLKAKMRSMLFHHPSLAPLHKSES